MAQVERDGAVCVWVRLAENAARSLRLDYAMIYVGGCDACEAGRVPLCDDGETLGWACYLPSKAGWRVDLVNVYDERGRSLRLSWHELWPVVCNPDMGAIGDALDIWVMGQTLAVPFTEVYAPELPKGDIHAN